MTQYISTGVDRKSERDHDFGDNKGMCIREAHKDVARLEAATQRLNAALEAKGSMPFTLPLKEILFIFPSMYSRRQFQADCEGKKEAQIQVSLGKPGFNVGGNLSSVEHFAIPVTSANITRFEGALNAAREAIAAGTTSDGNAPNAREIVHASLKRSLHEFRYTRP
jgi:hypothetical protein